MFDILMAAQLLIVNPAFLLSFFVLTFRFALHKTPFRQWTIRSKVVLTSLVIYVLVNGYIVLKPYASTPWFIQGRNSEIPLYIAPIGYLLAVGLLVFIRPNINDIPPFAVVVFAILNLMYVNYWFLLFVSLGYA